MDQSSVSFMPDTHFSSSADDSPAPGELTAPAAGRKNGAKRVCMLVYTFYESDNRVLRYARALVDRGDQVDVIALGSGENQPRFEVVDGVNVYRVQRRLRDEKNKYSYLWRLVRFCFNSCICLCRLQFKHRYDVVHVHNVPDFLVFSAWLPKLAGVKIILDIHDILPEFFANKFRRPETSGYVRMLRGIEWISARFANHVIISNHLWREKITRRSVANEKCSVFINHVDQTIFNCRRARNDDRFIVLYHGGLQRHQGLDIAIRAFGRIHGQVSGAEFHIYGGGNVKPEMEALIQQLGLKNKVLLFEPKPMREIAQVVANADLGVVAKRADSFGNEAYSTKIMEYMAEGVPVIVSRTKVDSFYFNDSIVRFFESGNELELANAMLCLMIDAGSRERLARNAREFVAMNNWDVKKHEYLHLVDSLCPSSAIQAGLAETSAAQQ
jgi:glycosyltransferase involved in cell wall biosynthesis